jgi:tRNA pseudouridine38-40 synthase
MEPAQVNAKDRSPYAAYKSIVAYDGTDFHGSQRQKKDVRTVQSVLESALRKLGWDDGSILVAGRTDAGVHAGGQVIGFRLMWKHSPDTLCAALNSYLPRDAAVRETMRVSEDFHPRFSALKRCYSYTVFVGRSREPLHERYAWRLAHVPDLQALNSASALMLGEHDFGAFGTSPTSGGTTVRTVFSSMWRQRGEMLRFEIVANAFLYRMVRRIVAATLEVALGRERESSIRRLIDDPSVRWETRLAPARGLVLEQVEYPSDEDELYRSNVSDAPDSAIS